MRAAPRKWEYHNNESFKEVRSVKPLFPSIFPVRPSSPENDPIVPAEYWNSAPEQLLSTLKTSEKGLTQQEAEERLKSYGPNALVERRETTALMLFLSQFKSPLVLI